jgi:hypothetical protein
LWNGQIIYLRVLEDNPLFRSRRNASVQLKQRNLTNT